MFGLLSQSCSTELLSVKSGTPTNRRIENPLYYPRQSTFSDNLF
jgi:hypothetical protein